MQDGLWPLLHSKYYYNNSQNIVKQNAGCSYFNTQAVLTVLYKSNESELQRNLQILGLFGEKW